MRSPDQMIDAVIAIRETDATVATPTEVYLVPATQPIDGTAAWRADHVDGLRVQWTDATHLTIHADQARVFLKSDRERVSSKAGMVTIHVDEDGARVFP